MLEGRHKHLSDEEVARLMLARSTMEECSETVVPHLDALCPECRGTHRRLAALAQESGNWDVETVLHERALSGPAVQELVDLPQHERLARIRSSADLQTWEACVLLMLSSREAGFDKADLAVELASAALAVTERLGPRAYDAVWVADLRARARAQYGNALRVVGELRSASEQFQLALAELERGTGDPEVHGGVLSLLASLHIAQRRLDAAAATIKQAQLALRSARAGSRMGEHADEIGLALNEAMVFEEKGDLEGAARLLGDVAGWVDRERFPRLYGIALFNRGFVLAHMGREGAEQASQHLPEVLSVYLPTASPTDRLRVLWMQGLIHHELGELTGYISRRRGAVCRRRAVSPDDQTPSRGDALSLSATDCRRATTGHISRQRTAVRRRRPVSEADEPPSRGDDLYPPRMNRRPPTTSRIRRRRTAVWRRRAVSADDEPLSRDDEPSAAEADRRPATANRRCRTQTVVAGPKPPSPDADRRRETMIRRRGTKDWRRRLGEKKGGERDGRAPRQESYSADWTGSAEAGGGVSGSSGVGSFRGRPRNGCRPYSESFSSVMP
jgi:tetratricopeptide (TPR) repeat protein